MNEIIKTIFLTFLIIGAVISMHFLGIRPTSFIQFENENDAKDYELWIRNVFVPYFQTIFLATICFVIGIQYYISRKKKVNQS